MTQLNTQLEVSLITDIQQSPVNEIAPKVSDGTWRLLLGQKRLTGISEIPYITVTHKWFNANRPKVGQYIGSIAGNYVLLNESDITIYAEEEIKEIFPEAKNYIHEFKIRPVTRYLLTEYKENKKDRSGSSGIVGEYPSIESAERIGNALCKANYDSTFTTYSESPKKESSIYAILAKHTFKVENLVYFAYSYDEAVRLKNKAEAEHNKEFKIFSA